MAVETVDLDQVQTVAVLLLADMDAYHTDVMSRYSNFSFRASTPYAP